MAALTSSITVTPDFLIVSFLTDLSLGHAGVMLQARQLGHSLHVGIHSDEAILANKGPPVMNLAERVAAADACRWVTQSIPHAPYVTDLGWISHYGCRYVVHGDDITSDAGGEDCYRFVKQANRFKVVKRTPGISTTDLVGRMLLGSREHFIPSLRDMITGTGADALAMRERMTVYATDASGLAPGVNVYMSSVSSASTPEYRFDSFITGTASQPGQRIVYVDGGFDLFCSGHISFLFSVVQLEEKRAKAGGWSHDYSPCHVVAGIHDDHAINAAKEENYPIMNIFERGMCLLQCKVRILSGYSHCSSELCTNPDLPQSTSTPSSSPPLSSPALYICMHFLLVPQRLYTTVPHHTCQPHQEVTRTRT